MPERWQEIAAFVDRLLDTPRERRDALIDELSAGNPQRRQELEALRAECEREPALFSFPAAEQFAALFDDETPYPASLDDRYRKIRELGRGGMATVFLARDEKHGRDVAVKVVRPSVTAALGAERFLREIEIAAQLHHPHIVALYDSGEADGALYYVMPHEPEPSLRQRLVRVGPLPSEEVVRILRDVCDALAYAHARGIVHRDIKPDNVLLSGRHALLTDFGIAKAILESSARATPDPDAAAHADRVDVRRRTSDTIGGNVLGTPAYMAPEQIAARPVDHRTDLYAVGVLGYELLTGRPPFADGDRDDVLSAHLSATPAPLSTRRPDVPALLAAVVMRCLEKQPDDRWQSAEEMMHALAPLAGARGGAPPVLRRRWVQVAAVLAIVAALGAIAAVSRWREQPAASWRDRFARMRVEQFTDFPGSEVDATISRDGRLVAFLADRDGAFDAFVSEAGSGRFVNLTGGQLDQLYNEDVRNVGFTNDATHAWLRTADIASPASVSLVPTAGGARRPFLSTAVSAAWSPDGSKLVYHEATAGDPIFVADSGGANPRRLHVALPGLHSHYPTWSPDARFVYYTHGLPPDETDIWRIPSAGGTPERITSHASRVGYPVLLDDRTLLYTATDDDGGGPWLFMMNVNDRVATRLSSGVEHYTSVAASDEVAGRPRRLVATVSNPVVRLWTVPISSALADERAATQLSLPTARSAAPRFAPDASLLYLAARGAADGLWRSTAGGASELWKPPRGAVAGAAAMSPDGRRVCFAVRHERRSELRCASADGSDVRALADSLDVRGAPSWSPDGRWMAITARVGGGLRVFKVPADGGASVQLVATASSNPVWSPDGRYILYSGTSRGRIVPLAAVTPEGAPHPLRLPALAVDRIGDSYRFLPNGKGLVVKLGGFRRQDFWLFDLATGGRRRLTRLHPGESVHRFDVSPDGTRIVFERVRENSNIALLELPAR